MAGEIEHLDTSGIEDAIKMFKTIAKDFSESKKTIETTTSDLLSTWKGKSSREYEKQFELLTGSLNDITDTLYDLYDALVEVEAAYIEADEAVSNGIKQNG